MTPLAVFRLERMCATKGCKKCSSRSRFQLSPFRNAGERDREKMEHERVSSYK